MVMKFFAFFRKIALRGTAGLEVGRFGAVNICHISLHKLASSFDIDLGEVFHMTLSFSQS